MRGTFSLLNEDLCLTRSTIELYIRISYFGDSLITEMESPESIRKSFYARDETGDDYIYQFRELSMEQLQSGAWDSCIFPPTPKERERLICDCKEFERLKQLLGGNAELLAMLTGTSGEDEDEEAGGKGLGMGGAGGMADLDKDKSKKKPGEGQKGHGKNPLQEYLEAEAEHWKLLMEMLALARNAPKGLSPSVGTRKGAPCVSVMPCQPCPPCLPCLPCPPCKPCPPCYITSCSPCG